MSLTIPIAHDFICPWCWVGWLQSRRLQADYGVQIEWRGYELFPASLPRPVFTPEIPNPHRPPTLSRLEFLFAMEGLAPLRSDRPMLLDTHAAHEAVEFAKSEGVQDQLVGAIYEAFYLEAADISDLEVLTRLATGIVSDVPGMLQAIAQRTFEDRIVGFDAPAYDSGVFNVPTFFIGDARYAEQPYTVLEQALAREGVVKAGAVYADVVFPNAGPDRPYTFVNMVATIDGKILSGGRDESVADLGSAVDKAAMRRLESRADATLLGAGTLRATPKTWSPTTRRRIVVSASGNVPRDHKYLADGGEVVPTLDLHRLRAEGIERLLVLGGSELNAQLFAQDQVDEIFLTIAPKVKLGRDVPTLADGDALPREAIKRFELVESNPVGDEIFLRYRRKVE